MQSYKVFELELEEGVVTVTLNRPDKLNAMGEDFWREIVDVFTWINNEPKARVVILAAHGKHFCTGIDLHYLMALAAQMGQEVGRNALYLREQIKRLQQAVNMVQECKKPVIAAVHGYCLGGAVDLISACDMRYCSADATFAISEIDIGMAADLGSLQRLPNLIGQGQVRELAYTGRKVDAAEAEKIGLVNQVFADQAQMRSELHRLAAQIASKSPVAIQGTKQMLDYALEHSLTEGLEHVATWNAAMLQAADLRQALSAQMLKQTASFEDA